MNMKKNMPKDDLESLSKKLLTACDPQRLKILCHLFRESNVCVSEIAFDLDESVATISHHLQALAKEDLVSSRRNGKRICYELNKTEFTSDLKRLICKYK
jgi:DNA-binding transcriptional ArsR family regulator